MLNNKPWKVTGYYGVGNLTKEAPARLTRREPQIFAARGYIHCAI